MVDRSLELRRFLETPLSEQQSLVRQRIEGLLAKQTRSINVDVSQMVEYMQLYWNPSQVVDFVRLQSDEKSIGQIEEISSKLRSLMVTEQWQYLNDSGHFQSVSTSMSTRLSKLSIGEGCEWTGPPTYSIIRLSDFTAVQRRSVLLSMRHLRLALLSVDNPKVCLLWESKATVLPLKTQQFLHSLMVGARKSYNGCEYHRTRVDYVESVGPAGSVVYRRTVRDAHSNQDRFDNKNVDPKLFGSIITVKPSCELVLKSEVKAYKSIELIVSETQIRQSMEKELPSATMIQVKKVDDPANLTALATLVGRSHLFRHMTVVYHGTDPDTIPKIVKNGFNRDFSSVAFYGRGTYFASDFSVSAKYATVDSDDCRWMLVCLMGITHCKVGHKSILKPPLLDDGVTQVDTLVNRMELPSVLVAMKDSNAVPLWLLQFKLKLN